MTTIIIDGRTKVVFATAVASIAAPTTTELNAGTALETLLRMDGLNIKPNTAYVPNGNLGSTFSTERVGRRDAKGSSLGFHHVSGTDTAWLLTVFRTAGFLVIRSGIDRTTVWTAGDKVKVYPIEFGEVSDVPPAENTNWDFDAPFAVTDDYNVRAVVA